MPGSYAPAAQKGNGWRGDLQEVVKLLTFRTLFIVLLGGGEPGYTDWLRPGQRRSRSSNQTGPSFFFSKWSRLVLGPTQAPVK
jgi:hypothetical protein